MALVGRKQPAKTGDIRDMDRLVGKIPWRNGMAISLPGESPWTEKPGGLKFIGLKRVEPN